MTSRGNQSVSPPAQISQQRHVNTVSSGTPPPQQYYQGSPSAIQQSSYDYLSQGQAFLNYQPVQTYGNDIRGQPGNNGRGGPIQQSLPQNFFHQHGPNMRPQQIQQGPTASQTCFISTQGPGTFCQPRPQSQPSSQAMMYYNLQTGNNAYALPAAAAMYGGPQTVPVYQQNAYMHAYQPGIAGYPNGIHWRNQGVAPTTTTYIRPQPRERKVLEITDPNTGRSITEEIFSNRAHPADTEDLYEQIPQVNTSKKEICQTFTRLVADRLKSPDEPAILGTSPDSQGAVGGISTGPSQQYQQQFQEPQQQLQHQQHHPQQQVQHQQSHSQQQVQHQQPHPQQQVQHQQPHPQQQVQHQQPHPQVQHQQQSHSQQQVQHPHPQVQHQQISQQQVQQPHPQQQVQHQQPHPQQQVQHQQPHPQHQQPHPQQVQHQQSHVQVQHQQSHPQQQVQHPHPQQMQHQLPQQQVQQQPSSKGPAPMMRPPMNGPPPTISHQGMPSRTGLIQQPPASETPPHDIQHQMLNVNLSMPPPQLPIRQSAPTLYSSPQLHTAHHVPHHQQTPQQQQSFRPQMIPATHVPHQQVQAQPQHQTPQYNQQLPPVNSVPHPVLQDLGVSEENYSQGDIPSQNNIPTQLPEPSVPIPTAKTISPVTEEPAGPPRTEQISDAKSLSVPSSVKVATSFGDEDQINDKTEDIGKEASQGASNQGVRDGRKTKKNLKGLNRKDIAGSDMDAFIDKMEETNIEDSDGNMSKTNNALESPPTDTAVNGASILESATGHASFVEQEAKQGTTAANNKHPDLQKDVPTPELTSEVSLDNGHSKEDSRNPQKHQEHQRQAATTVQVDSKSKQKKNKKKKGHQSPPNQKSKQNTSNDSSEKQNDTADTDRQLSLTSADADNAESQDSHAAVHDTPVVIQDRPVVQDTPAVLQDKPAIAQVKPAVAQDKPAVAQDKPAVTQDKPAVAQDKPAVAQDKPAVAQDKPATAQDKPAAVQNKPAVLQDKPPVLQEKPVSQDLKTSLTSSVPTQETLKMTIDSLPQKVRVPQQQPVDTKTETGFIKEEGILKTAAITTDSVIPDNSDASKQENQVLEKSGSSIRSNYNISEQRKSSPGSDVQKDKPVQHTIDSTFDTPENHISVEEDEHLQDSLVKEENLGRKKEQTYEEDGEFAPRKPSFDASTANRDKKGTKEKLQYDRAYLMELRDCPSSLAKPEGLPDLEIILELPLANAGRGVNVTPLDFTPSFFQPSSTIRNAPQIGKTNSRTRQRPDLQMPQRVIKSVSLQDSVKPLHQSEKPWKPTPKQLSTGELSEKSKTLESAILFIMNRLTPTNFERLAEEMMHLNIKTYEDLKELVKIIFDKVTIETKFVEAYAKLCKVMSSLKVIPAPDSGIKESQATFRVVMLTKCQQEFEADKTSIFEDPEEKRKKMESEMPAGPEKSGQIDTILYHMKMKRLKFYGNIRFIGELFKLNMLTENIMHDCIYRLLKAKDDDSLVSLCNLISTVGQALDTEKSKVKMDNYFSQMAKISDERKSRIKFTLKDIIDLRNNSWIPRKEQAGPKKIDEVHKDFQQEQATKQFLQSQPLPPRIEAPQANARRSSRQRQEDKQQQQQQADDGWNTVGSKSQRIDATRMRLSKNVVDDNIQLGPGGGMNKLSIWGKGSYGGSQQSQENERPPAANRFSALRGEDDRRGYQRSPTRDSGMASRGTRQGSNTGHGQGKVLSRSSQEGERRDALESARSIGGGRFQNLSRDNSRNREDSRQPVVVRGSREGENPLARSNGSQRPSNDSFRPRSAEPPTTTVAGAAAASYDDDQMVKKLKPLSEAEMEQKAKTILEEYLSVLDLEEAKLCMRELGGQVHLSILVTSCINETLEKSYKARDLTGSFFHEMIKHGLLPLKVYCDGLSEVLTYAEDMVIDIPKIWTYLAQTLVPTLVGGSVSWSALTSALKSSLDKKCSLMLITEVLLVAKEKTSESELAEMWQSSPMDWSTFLDSEEKLQYLKDKQLEFTVQPVASRTSSKSQGSSQGNYQKLIEDIESIIHRKGSNNEIFTCINKHVTTEKYDKNFIRAIVTAIVNASVSSNTKKLIEDVLKSHKEVLQQFIKNDINLELQALYAIQALMHKLEHPSGMIASIFNILYDEEVITEDTFKQWEKSTDSQEAEGKGICSMQLTQFFSWLRENEDIESS